MRPSFKNSCPVLRPRHPARNNQHGAVLIVALIFMVILTVVALTSMNSSTFEIKIARSVKSQLDALNASENILKEAEQDICAFQHIPGSGNCGGGPDLALFNTAGDGYYSGPELNNITDSSVFFGKYREAASSAVGSYTVEYLKAICMPGCSCAAGEDNTGCQQYLYRITSSGQSAKGGNKLIQSQFFTIH